tara:strand:- start:399 stop:791 length:393 start_codon:yes stop_codon:yes gene_type:complete
MSTHKSKGHKKEKKKSDKTKNSLSRRGLINQAVNNCRSTRKVLLDHNPDIFKKIRQKLVKKPEDFYAFLGLVGKNKPNPKVSDIKLQDLEIDNAKNREAVEKLLDHLPEHSGGMKDRVKAMLEQQNSSIH